MAWAARWGKEGQMAARRKRELQLLELDRSKSLGLMAKWSDPLSGSPTITDVWVWHRDPDVRGSFPTPAPCAPPSTAPPPASHKSYLPSPLPHPPPICLRLDPDLLPAAAISPPYPQSLLYHAVEPRHRRLLLIALVAARRRVLIPPPRPNAGSTITQAHEDALSGATRREYTKHLLLGGLAVLRITATGHRKTTITRVVLEEGTSDVFINLATLRDVLDKLMQGMVRILSKPFAWCNCANLNLGALDLIQWPRCTMTEIYRKPPAATGNLCKMVRAILPLAMTAAWLIPRWLRRHRAHAVWVLAQLHVHLMDAGTTCACVAEEAALTGSGITEESCRLVSGPPVD
ncbi:hypothetical protein U9M48_002517 [Paspalum notatum var. saurae]|uniref:Uncharacterized protein n=1 Tax=Paspalum notatum var. saurae TaxID=547442 RepID=A0AAQ3PJK3_PASNO